MNQAKRDQIRHFPNNCPINEQTADGRTVGRCWFHLGNAPGCKVCPRHGDVAYAVDKLPSLTLESQHRLYHQPAVDLDPVVKLTWVKKLFKR